MADLMLKVNGDSSGAAAALQQAGGAVEDLGDDVGKSVVKWQELANITKKAVELVVKFGIDAVKAYAESERVQKQLTRAAGEYAEVLGEQAEAMSKVYAVDDDIIKQSQILLTQWGGVGAATEETTKAILNYAAATGQDAVSATQDLIRNVESGGAGLAKMGVHFTATGDRGKDLTAAVGALNKKFAGAAAANADTLQGSLQLAGMAFEDLKKDLGESITQFLTQTGAVNALTQALRNMREFVSGKERDALIDEGLKQGAIINARKELAYAEEELNAAMMEGQSQTILELFSQDVINAQAKLDKLLGDAKKLTKPEDVPVTGETNKGGKDRAAAEAAALAEAEKAKAISEKVAEQTRADMKRDEELDDQARAERQAAFAKTLQDEAGNVKDRLKLLDDAAKARTAIRLDEEKKAAEIAERQAQNEKRIEEQAAKDREAAMQKRAAQAKQIADEIGAAFVNAMSSQLQKLAEGGEFDAAAFIGDILSAVAGIAGTVIGTYFGAPAVGAALGNLAGMGIKAGFTSLSASGKKRRTYHSGGWVGDEAELPRYHSGTWVGGDERPAILQTGERVLSRAEVARMGGQGGVDAAARGRGAGVTINVTALDSKSAARAFETDVGRGLALARRSGRGDVARMLGFEGVPR